MKKQIKKNSYAIWVDHKKAIIVCVDANGKSTANTIKSAIEPHQRFGGETSDKTRLFGKTINQESKHQNKEHEITAKFMKEILSAMVQPSVIIIMGPANAKYDLHKQLDKTRSLKPDFVEMKTTDKLTTNEIKSILANRLLKGIPV